MSSSISVYSDDHDTLAVSERKKEMSSCSFFVVTLGCTMMWCVVFIFRAKEKLLTSNISCFPFYFTFFRRSLAPFSLLLSSLLSSLLLKNQKEIQWQKGEMTAQSSFFPILCRLDLRNPHPDHKSSSSPVLNDLLYLLWLDSFDFPLFLLLLTDTIKRKSKEMTQGKIERKRRDGDQVNQVASSSSLCFPQYMQT